MQGLARTPARTPPNTRAAAHGTEGGGRQDGGQRDGHPGALPVRSPGLWFAVSTSPELTPTAPCTVCSPPSKRVFYRRDVVQSSSDTGTSHSAWHAADPCPLASVPGATAWLPAAGRGLLSSGQSSSPECPFPHPHSESQIEMSSLQTIKATSRRLFLETNGDTEKG